MLLAGADGLVKASSYLLLPVYLSHMTKGGFAVSSFQFVTSAPLTTLCSLGLYVPLIRDFRVEKELDSRRRNFSSIVCVVFAWMLLMLALSLTPWAENIYRRLFTMDTESSQDATIFVLLIVVGIGHLFVYATLMAESVVKSLAIYSIARFLFSNTFSLSFLIFSVASSDVRSRMAGYVAGDASCLAVFATIMLRKHFKPAFHWVYLKGAFALGASILPSGLLALTSATYDRYLIVQYWGRSELADYNLAMLLSSPLSLLVAATQVALVPTLYSAPSLAHAQALARRAFLVTLATLLVIGLLIFVAVVLSFRFSILPQSYSLSIPLLLPCLLVTILSALWNYPASILIREKRTGLLFGMSSFGLLLSMASLYLLVPEHGALGAIAANTFAFGAGLTICAFFASKRSLRDDGALS